MDTWRVSDGVKVRRESFGLLFYNTRDTRLTFVRSGDLIDISPGGLTMKTDDRRLATLLASLRDKGLLR